MTIGVRSIPRALLKDLAFQRCIVPGCETTLPVDDAKNACPACGGLLDIGYEWDRLPVPSSLREFEARWSNRRDPLDFSGVWRFRELLPFAPPEAIVTIGEGQTILRPSESIAKYTGLRPDQLFLQYEGLNPSGSFKDNGMTAAATHARMVGAKVAACASTGNTSASLAIFASATGLFRVVVFVGSGKISYGKLAQALDYGSLTIQILGDFDDALLRVREVCDRLGIYLCNSVNPFRLEGQKAIIYRVLEGLDWESPDWIVVPGGNLGNSSAFGKAFAELKQLGLIDRVPRLAVINATGANTLYRLYEKDGLRWNGGRPQQNLMETFFAQMESEGRRASTLASAIQINRPVNLSKCLRALEVCDGVVREVSDQEIAQGVIAPGDRVVCILTGHELKDPNATVAYHSAEEGKLDKSLAAHGVQAAPFANHPHVVANDLDAIVAALANSGIRG
jgi:threonine synthase